METDVTDICNKCQTTIGDKPPEDALDKCNNWLSRCTVNDDCNSLYSENTECSDFSETTNNSAMDSGFQFENSGVVVSDLVKRDNDDDNDNYLNINKIVKKEPTIIDQINIYKSKKVHIGDVNYIYLNQPSISENVKNNNNSNFVITSGEVRFSVIPRRNWLAQPPINPPKYLEKPANFVIICHSATEEGFTQAENTLLVRLCQTFHVESRDWDDIAYNFLIGSDGSVFEGRGWRVVGSHTMAYNSRSVGICFIGCFNKHLPPKISLDRAKALIQHGVKLGAIDKDFSLLGHRQCNTFASPGERLYQEIQTWDNWDSSIQHNSPSPLIIQ